MKYLILRRDLLLLRDMLKESFVDRWTGDLFFMFNQLTTYEINRINTQNLEERFQALQPDQIEFKNNKFAAVWKKECERFFKQDNLVDIKLRLRIMKIKVAEELFWSTTVADRISSAVDELERLKDIEPEQLERLFKWCEVLGGPVPTVASFDSQTYNLKDDFLTDLTPAGESNLWFVTWSLSIVLSPVIMVMRHMFVRDLIAPEYRLAESDLSQYSWYRLGRRMLSFLRLRQYHVPQSAGVTWIDGTW